MNHTYVINLVYLLLAGIGFALAVVGFVADIQFLLIFGALYCAYHSVRLIVTVEKEG